MIQLTVPGGAIIGCSAGFLNAQKIKGSHTALKSGMVAAEATFELLTADPSKTVATNGEIDPDEGSLEAMSYSARMETSWVYEELFPMRNCHASFHMGLVPGLIYTWLSSFIVKGRESWTLQNHSPDSQKTRPASDYTPIDYPKPDNIISFDLLTSVDRSGTSHDHDQPVGLLRVSFSWRRESVTFSVTPRRRISVSGLSSPPSRSSCRCPCSMAPSSGFARRVCTSTAPTMTPKTAPRRSS